MEPTEGVIVAGRFRLERRLGQGGMGAVWLARHLSLDIPCALKFLHPEGADQLEARQRFEREAKAAAQLRSPNVVQVLDHGVWQDSPFIAMELLEGEDLQQRLHRVRRLDPRDTFVILAQVGRALGKAHAAGLVHRDLKPGNIFLVRDDDREVAKVLDFGVAKNILEVGDAKTQTGALMGTPYYMSPEQARGIKEIDHRSDLWAVGVIAYQCLLGRLPFPGEALGDLLMKIIAEPLPVPSQIAGPHGIPPGFDAWWARAAARDPNHRFQSARELTDALGVALGISVGVTDAYASSASGIRPLAPGIGGAAGAIGAAPGYPPRSPMTGSGVSDFRGPPSYGTPAAGGYAPPAPASHPSYSGQFGQPGLPSAGYPAPPSHPSYGGQPAHPNQPPSLGYGVPPSPGSHGGFGPVGPVTGSPVQAAPPPAPVSYGSAPFAAPQTANPLATPISPTAPGRSVVGTAVAIGAGIVITAGVLAGFVLRTQARPAATPEVATAAASLPSIVSSVPVVAPSAAVAITPAAGSVAPVAPVTSGEPAASASGPTATSSAASSGGPPKGALGAGRLPGKGGPARPRTSSHDDGI